MRLIMIRHGQPEWSSPLLISLSRFERLFADYKTARLSKEGINAIRTLVEQLPDGLVLSSDLPRAKETAEIIAGQNGKTVTVDPVFRELQPPRIAARLVGKLWLPPFIWLVVRWCCWPLGVGESLEPPRAAWHRATQAANKILGYLETEETIILISHGWFMTLLAMCLRQRGLVESGPLIPKTGYGAVTAYTLRVRLGTFGED